MKREQDNLTEAIELLKKKQAIELRLLKEQVHVVHESFKPLNLLKGAIHQITSSPEIKGNIIDNIIGLASGYISKTLFVAGSHNPITHILGNLVQMGVANVASKNADPIKSIGEKIFQFVFKKSNKNELKASISDN